MSDKFANHKDLEFIGYDLGHGETAVARVWSRSNREPEILEYLGEKSFVTAIARDKTGVRIGAQAVNMAALNTGFGKKTGSGKTEIWTKFKSRDLDDENTNLPTSLFTQTLFKSLEDEKKISGMQKSQFIVGCPSGWDIDDRAAYLELLQSSGLKNVRTVPESRAALMSALEQGYLSLEAARSSVLIVDIGSSTTDFTYCVDLDAEDVGHNILGSGLLDRLIFELNLQRQKERKKIEKLIAKYPYYRPILEYWCRQAKEQYFNGEERAVEIIRRLPVESGVLFEIKIDKQDAKEILSAPIAALNGFSWPETFDYALKEAVERLGGRAPETVLLTGGASRLPLITPACEKAFPEARIVRGAEPEFAIAKGLAWLGRFEYLYKSFTHEVEALVNLDGDVYQKAKKASAKLGDVLAPVLVDELIEACVIPAFADWRKGEIKTLDEVEKNLDKRLGDWLNSETAKQALRPKIENWFSDLQREIEQITDPLCREHNLPAMVLSLDDSTHIAKHLESLQVSAPKMTGLENDIALVGTTLSTIIIGVLLSQVHLLAPLLANPISLLAGGAIGVGGFIYGKKSLKGKLQQADFPVVARRIMTDGRVRKAAKSQRDEMIKAVAKAWNEKAAKQFTSELVATLKTAFLERADERAVLFLL